MNVLRRVQPRAMRRLSILLAPVLVGAMVAVVPLAPAHAASGDFSLNFVAAAPYSYDHLVGGGAFDDATKGKNADIVESLEAVDFSCGDIVTYLTQVSVADTAQAGTDGPQTIEVDYQFLMNTTGQSGAAIGDITRVNVNYAPVVDTIAGEDTVDQGIVDDGGSVATLVSETQTGPMFASGSKLNGTVRVTDLERAEKVIVRVDVRLFCKPGSRPTGNLQGAVAGARLTAIKGTVPVSPATAISVGNQTIPFMKFADLHFPELAIAKTVTTAGGTCPGTESIDIHSGDAVKYCYRVTNPSNIGNPPGAALYDLTSVRDDNRTPSNPADDFTVTLTGLTDVDGDGQNDDLAPGGQASGEKIVNIVASTTGISTNTATVTGYTFPGDTTQPLTASDTASVNVQLIPAPGILLTKSVTDASGDGKASLGEVLTYTFTLKNTGNVPLSDLRISDPRLWSGTQPCTDTSPLAAGGTRVCLTFVYTVTAGDLLDPSVANTATGSGQPPSGNRVSDDASATIPTRAEPAILMTKGVTDASGDGKASLGEVLTYTFTVTNTGDVPLSDVRISDSKLWAGTKPCTNTSALAVGDSRVCLTQTYTVTAGDLLDPNVANTATGSGQPPNGGRVSDDDTASIPSDPAPEILLTKSVTDANGDGKASLGEVLTYTFTVTNTGNVPLSDIRISDSKLWAGTKPCTDTSPLAVGGTRVCLTFTYPVTAADLLVPNLSNTATGSGQPPHGDRVSDDDSATIPTRAEPAILMTKTVTDASGDGKASLGEVLTYTFTLKNTGDVPLTDLRISDPRLWAGTKPCTDTSALAVGGTRVCLTFTYTVTAADLLEPNVANTATGSGEAPSGNRVSDDDSATIPTNAAPAILLTKSVTDASGDGRASLGEVLTYTFTVKNTGDVPLSDLQIADSRLWPGTAPCTNSSALAVGASRVCLTFTYTVTAGDVADPNMVNTATASGQAPTGDRVSDDDTATIPTEPTATDANLSIKKTVDVSQAAPGDTVTYTLTVKNTGPGAAEDVVVTDNLPSGTTFVSATSPCTESGGTVSCDLGTLGAGDTTIITIKVKVAPIAGGDTSHQHQLDYTKVESHLSLFEDDTVSATATCPTGYFATDGSVRLDHVDQGTGTFEDAIVLASGVAPDGKSWTGKVRNDATGQVQAKVNVVCMTVKTTSGEDHSHDVVVTGPVGSSQTFAAGRHDVDLTCGTGNYAISPSFAFTSGQGVVSTRRLAGGGWRFTVDVDDPAQATFSIQCLSTSLAAAQGHSHDLAFTEITDTVTVPAGQVKEVQLTCPTGYKGIVAWADMDPGLVSLGNDPQPITRVFRFYNPTGGPLTADYGLLCVAIRTNGGASTGGTIKNTASVSTSSPDASSADDQDSASFQVNTTGVAVAARASVVTQAGKTLVKLGVKASGKRAVTFKLLATSKVKGTRLKSGSLLAKKGTKLRNGKGVVRLAARSAAAKALKGGKVRKARLVITTRDGRRDVRTVTIRR